METTVVSAGGVTVTETFGNPDNREGTFAKERFVPSLFSVTVASQAYLPIVTFCCHAGAVSEKYNTT